MGNVSKEDIYASLVDEIKADFEEIGFHLVKDRFFEKKDERGYLFQYEMRLSQKQGQFLLSLKLHLKNDSLMKEVNSLLLEVLTDVRFKFPEEWDEHTISRAIKDRTSTKTIASVTDWRIFKEEKERLESFNQRFNIWFTMFLSLDDIRNWQKQIKQSVSYAHTWFEEMKSNENIVRKSWYPSLLILKKEGDNIRLNKRYTELHEKSMTHSELKELELFWEYLKT